MLQIPSPNTDRSLLTIAELRAAAGVTGTARDAELQVVGDATAALITSACQVKRVGAIPPTLRLEAVVETFARPLVHSHLSLSVGRDGALWPSRLPIVSVESVVESTRTLTTSEYQIDGAALYRLSAGSRMHWCGHPIVVSYTAGFATVPADLKWAAMKFVQAALIENGRDPLLKRKVTVGVSEYEWFVDLTKQSVVPPEVMDILVRGGYANRWAWMR
jgi:hypothetical protein